jgi:hypothetical protein
MYILYPDKELRAFMAGRSRDSMENDGFSRALFITRGGDVYLPFRQGVARIHHQVVMRDAAKTTGFPGKREDRHQEGGEG